MATKENELKASDPKRLKVETEDILVSEGPYLSLTELTDNVFELIFLYLSQSLNDLFSFSWSSRKNRAVAEKADLQLNVIIKPAPIDGFKTGVELLTFIRLRTPWKVRRLIIDFKRTKFDPACDIRDLKKKLY